MANRRQVHRARRRVQSRENAWATVIRQEKDSSREGPDDSVTAQKAQSN